MRSPAWRATIGATILSACSSVPLAQIYVLSPPADPVAVQMPEAGRPVLEVLPVLFPDYLDTTDLLSRNGLNEVVPSRTGKWGERLSIGTGHALAAYLRERLPGTLVVQTPLAGQQTVRKLAVNVEGFDILPDGRCVLTARWALARDDGQVVLAAERDTIVSTIRASGPRAGADDAAIVSAMEDAIAQLADRIAAVSKRSPTGMR
jgi:uncharacterized lipoprotein YmbA